MSVFSYGVKFCGQSELSIFVIFLCKIWRELRTRVVRLTAVKPADTLPCHQSVFVKLQTQGDLAMIFRNFRRVPF